LRSVRKNLVAADLKAALLAPAGCAVLDGTFEAWATTAVGNCGESASADCILWATAICTRTRLDIRPFQPEIDNARETGKAEFAEFMRLRREFEGRDGQLKVPDVYGYAQREGGLNDFLVDIIRQNGALPHPVLKKGWEEQRAKVVALRIEDDGDLLKWEKARDAARLKGRGR
jgi:hypothetical protein